MWSLYPPPLGIENRPSNVVGTITDGGNAYDLDSYPWSTAAVGPTKVGSAVANVGDAVNVEFNTFGSLAKANFSTCELACVVSGTHSVTFSGPQPSSLYDLQHGVFVEYQVDGATWVTISTLGIGDTGNFLPGQWEDGPTITSGSSRSASKLLVSATIPSSAFATDLSDLKVRIRTYTVSYTGTGYTWTDTTNYSVWDILAVIS